MKSLVLVLLLSIPAFAQHPDSLLLSRYGEPTWPSTKKSFLHVRVGNHVDDTSQFIWNSFGKIAETEDGATMYAYQLQWSRATATFYFTISDSALMYYPNFRETEDSDAVYEIRIPIRNDNTWQYKLTDTTTARITGDNETVTVPAGTYQHCIVTQVKEGNEIITRTFAADVGLIKIVTAGNEFTKTAELVGMQKP